MASPGPAVTDALERTRTILFQPFDVQKWLGLALAAFLANCGRGGGGGSGRINDLTGSRSGSTPEMRDALDWMRDNTAILLGLAGALIVLVLIATVITLWLRARGQVLFVDGVARNSGAVREPWNRLAHHADRLFWFTLILEGIPTLLALGLSVGIGALWLPDVLAGRFEPSTAELVGVAIAGGFVAVVLIAFAVALLVTMDFVVPIMLIRDQSPAQAWGTLRHDVAPGRLGEFVLFYLVKLGLALLIALITFVVTLCTCCVAALPYVGTVILLPLYVFMRAYSLSFLAQFGSEWSLFRDLPTAEPPVAPF